MVDWQFCQFKQRDTWVFSHAVVHNIGFPPQATRDNKRFSSMFLVNRSLHADDSFREHEDLIKFRFVGKH